MKRASTQLSARDHDIIEAVQVLSQVTAGQLQRLFFADGSPVSRSGRARRTLRRLHGAGFIDRLPYTIRSEEAGDGGNVYIPARAKANRYDPHTIDIGRFYIALMEAERAGLCKVLEFSPAEVIRGSTAKCDAYLWLDVNGIRTDWYAEIDRNPEGKPQLAVKARAYTKAAKRADVFPRTLYVVTHALRGRMQDRASLIRSVTARQEYSEQFQTCVLDEAVKVLLSA